MGPVGWIMLFVHIALFVYLRKRYVGKKNRAEKRAAEYEIENLELRSKVKDYKDLFGDE